MFLNLIVHVPVPLAGGTCCCCVLGTAYRECWQAEQRGVVCQNRAAPRAPVKSMSNMPETTCQNHDSPGAPPVKTKPCSQGPAAALTSITIL